MNYLCRTLSRGFLKKNYICLSALPEMWTYIFKMALLFSFIIKCMKMVSFNEKNNPKELKKILIYFICI